MIVLKYCHFWSMVTLVVAFVVIIQDFQVHRVNGVVQCAKSTYPPDKRDKIEWHVVNLDDSPELRWRHLAVKKRKEIIELINVVKQSPKYAKIINLVEKLLAVLVNKISAPYADEIKGIANATNIPIGDMVLYNIFYEISSYCTSIVAQDESGEIYHARNLDFGGLSWDNKTDDWLLTDRLRPLVVNVDFQRKGKTVYRAVTFIGYVGILTGVKPGVFSITLNQRYSKNDYYIGIIEWALGWNKAKFTTLLLRDALENATSYHDTVNVLSKTELIAPVYYIVAGIKPEQGCAITRSRKKSLHPMSLNATSSVWYVVETNYDNWLKAPADDDRRDAAKQCLNKTTQQHVALPTMFDVLSTKPVWNKGTVYTTLIRPKTGHLESYIRYCAVCSK